MFHFDPIELVCCFIQHVCLHYCFAFQQVIDRFYVRKWLVCCLTHASSLSVLLVLMFFGGCVFGFVFLAGELLHLISFQFRLEFRVVDRPCVVLARQCRKKKSFIHSLALYGLATTLFFRSLWWSCASDNFHRNLFRYFSPKFCCIR